MANNRMSLVCDECGSSVMLFRFWDGVWYMGDPRETVPQVEQWLADHVHGALGDGNTGATHFSLAFESKRERSGHLTAAASRALAYIRRSDEVTVPGEKERLGVQCMLERALGERADGE